jgi:hypothetical protein
MGSCAVSPVRNKIVESGMERLVAPVAQFTLPVAAPDRAFRKQKLNGVEAGFGIAIGAPKRQPALVQFLLLPPVCVDVVAPTVAVWPAHDVMAVTKEFRSGTGYGSGMALPPPPW